jgi:hypothetical protein
MPRFYACALLLYICAGNYSGEEGRPLLGPGAPVTATPVPLDPFNPSRRTVGVLTFLGGWQLTSPDPAFGSISAMALNGRRFTMLSDSGGLMQFDLDDGGRATRVQFTDLPSGPTGGWTKGSRDSESMTADPQSGRAWVGFESRNQIWRYSPGFKRAEAHAWPPALRDWPPATGPESMVRLRSGKFVLIAENADGPHGSDDALLFPGDPTTPGIVPLRFGYRLPPGYRVTDALELPDGRLLVLHRKVTMLKLKLRWINGRPRIVRGIQSLLRIVDIRGVKPGQVVDGIDIARLAWPLTADNFEAMALGREGGKTILWIASDDNYTFYQRTLLMKFAFGRGSAVPSPTPEAKRP